MKHATALLVALALLLSFALPAAAAATEQTITVSALGEIKVKPDTLIISGKISETNEKMKDAVTGFKDTQRRALAAINELGIENMSVTTSALSVSLAGAMGAGPFGGIDVEEPATPGALAISQSVRLTVSGVDKMDQQAVIDLVVKVMEGVKEAGVDMSGMDAQSLMMMQMGMGGASSGSAVFKVSDPELAYKAATKAAVDKARADAAYLAELVGGKLGPVVRISDNPLSDDDSNPYAMMWGMMTEEEAEPNSSTTLDEIKVARALTVSFQLITE